MTFESTPADYSSVNDYLIYVVYDAHAADPVTYPNYKYVCELWVDGTKVFTKRLFPHPDTNRGIFDFGAVIREYVTNTLNNTVAAVRTQELLPGEFATKDIVVKVREEVDGVISAVLLTDSARTFYNHYNGRHNDFTILGPYAAKPLSTRPANLSLLFTSAYYFIPYFSLTTTAFDVVFTIGASTHTETVTPTATKTMQLINIAPAAINAEFGGGTITSAVTDYTVTINGEGPYRVKVVCPGFYRNYMVHFMNRFGGFESMLFNKVSRKQNENEKKSWQQLPFRVNGSGAVSVKTGTIMHDQKTTFASRYKEKVQISTDWLNDAEYTWLAELVNSPYVYVEDAGTLYPVQVANTNYEYKEVVVDSLTNLKIDIEYGPQYKTQFR